MYYDASAGLEACSLQTPSLHRISNRVRHVIRLSQDLNPLSERSTPPSRLPPGVAGVTLPTNAEVMEQVRRSCCSVAASAMWSSCCANGCIASVKRRCKSCAPTATARRACSLALHGSPAMQGRGGRRATCPCTCCMAEAAISPTHVKSNQNAGPRQQLQFRRTPAPRALALLARRRTSATWRSSGAT